MGDDLIVKSFKSIELRLSDYLDIFCITKNRSSVFVIIQKHSLLSAFQLHISGKFSTLNDFCMFPLYQYLIVVLVICHVVVSSRKRERLLLNEGASFIVQ